MSGSAAAETQRILGELVASVRALNDKLDDRRVEAKEAEERIREEIRNVKHEQRSREQAVSGRLELLEAQSKIQQLAITEVSNEVTAARRDVGEVRKELGDVKTDIEAVRAPVERLVALRDRLGAVAALAVSMMLVLWALVEPFLKLGIGRLGAYLLGWKYD